MGKSLSLGGGCNIKTHSHKGGTNKTRACVRAQSLGLSRGTMKKILFAHSGPKRKGDNGQEIKLHTNDTPFPTLYYYSPGEGAAPHLPCC